MRRWAQIVMVAVGLSCATVASAQDEPSPIAVKLGVDQNQVVTAELNVTSTFTEQFRKKLGGGLTSHVLIEVVLQDPSGNDLAVRVRSCQLRLDVWDDVVYVGVRDGSRQKRGTFAVIDAALGACGVVSDFQLADYELFQKPDGYRVLVNVALNPVSPELLERTREFMSNPRGSGGGRPRAFFGAVARLFRSDGSAGGETFAFKSKALARPKAGG
jgi:hypothetical protein